MTNATDLVKRAQDVLTVRRVFGEPIERDGVTVVPVVRFAAGAGAGSDDGGPDGDGRPVRRGGYGLKAIPAGVFVIRDGAVRWLPASTSIGSSLAVSSWPSPRCCRCARI